MAEEDLQQLLEDRVCDRLQGWAELLSIYHIQQLAAAQMLSLYLPSDAGQSHDFRSADLALQGGDRQGAPLQVLLLDAENPALVGVQQRVDPGGVGFQVQTCGLLFLLGLGQIQQRLDAGHYVSVLVCVFLEVLEGVGHLQDSVDELFLGLAERSGVRTHSVHAV